MACERNHIKVEEHELQMKYLDHLPGHVSVHLEDKLRKPPEGWTHEAMMKEVEEYFEVRQVYLVDRDGGMTRNRNRATWSNDSKMMRTPLVHQGTTAFWAREGRRRRWRSSDW